MHWKQVLSVILAVSGVLLFASCGGASSDSGGNGGGGNSKSAEFLYATTGCCLIQMQLDTSTGNLSVPTFTGSGITGYGLSATPSKSFLYANSANGIYGFSLASTGLLTPLSNFPISFPSSADFSYENNLTITPSGKFLYSAYNDTSSPTSGAVAAFSIDVAGNLTQVPSSPFIAGNLPVATAVDPAGSFLYVANENSGSVSVFSIDSNTGALTEIAGSPVSSGSLPLGLSVHPSGKFLYVVNYAFGPNGGLTGFSVDSASGALTAIPGSPWLTNVPNAHSSLISSLVIHPSGAFLYVADGVGDIYAFSIDSATGGLTPISGSPFGNFSSFDPYSLAIDPSGKYLYDAGLGFYPGMVSFQIDGNTGALTPAGTPIPGSQHIGVGTLGLLPLKLP